LATANRVANLHLDVANLSTSTGIENASIIRIDQNAGATHLGRHRPEERPSTECAGHRQKAKANQVVVR
jgi:hypothetical protein